MSSLDSYRRNVTRRREEIAKLQQGKAKEQTKIANLSGKINSSSQALSRANSESTAKSKRREIERHQKDQAAAEKKVADFDNKIARKQKELSDEQKKVSREEEKESKERQRESERQARAHQSRMNHINSTLKALQDLPEKIVVLFLASNPANEQQLRLDEEARSIGDMIRKAKHRDSVLFESRWAVQPIDVLQAINELNPTIVHFSGHGSDSDKIVFQDANGNAKLVSKEAIVQTMMASSSDIRLVFFNTCYSYNQAEAVTHHVEAAIGMNTSIGDDAARVFSSQFYSAIGFGLSVKKAFEQAKALVMMEGLNEENTPELFVQEGLDSNDLVIVRPAGLEEKALESGE